MKIIKIVICTKLSIIILNVSGLSAQFKRYGKTEWIPTTTTKKQQDPYICCTHETHFRSKDTHRLKVKRWKRYFMKMEI